MSSIIAFIVNKFRKNPAKKKDDDGEFDAYGWDTPQKRAFMHVYIR